MIIEHVAIPLIAATVGGAFVAVFRRPPSYTMFLEAVQSWRALGMKHEPDSDRRLHISMECDRLEALIRQHPATLVLQGSRDGAAE